MDYITLGNRKYLIMSAFCELVKTSTRMGDYWIKHGMPHIKIGKAHKLIDIEAGIQWLISGKHTFDLSEYERDRRDGKLDIEFIPESVQVRHIMGDHQKRKYGKSDYTIKFNELWTAYHKATKVKPVAKDFAFLVYVRLLESGIIFNEIFEVVKNSMQISKAQKNADNKPFYKVLTAMKRKNK